MAKPKLVGVREVKGVREVRADSYLVISDEWSVIRIMRFIVTGGKGGREDKVGKADSYLAVSGEWSVISIWLLRRISDFRFMSYKF